MLASPLLSSFLLLLRRVLMVCACEFVYLGAAKRLQISIRRTSRQTIHFIHAIHSTNRKKKEFSKVQ